MRKKKNRLIFVLKRYCSLRLFLTISNVLRSSRIQLHNTLQTTWAKKPKKKCSKWENSDKKSSLYRRRCKIEVCRNRLIFHTVDSIVEGRSSRSSIARRFYCPMKLTEKAMGWPEAPRYRHRSFFSRRLFLPVRILFSYRFHSVSRYLSSVNLRLVPVHSLHSSRFADCRSNKKKINKNNNKNGDPRRVCLYIYELTVINYCFS